MRPVSPTEIRSLELKAKLWLCEPGFEQPVRRPAYVFRRPHATRIEVRYLDEQGRKVIIPWSLDTNKPINDPRSKHWLEYRE